MKNLTPAVALAALIASAGTAIAQGLPTSQPSILTISREEVKLGRNAEHAKIEAGWPAAYEKAKSPDYYLAITSMTGPNEAWFLTPNKNYTEIGDGMKRDESNAVLSAELTRLQRADADLLTGLRTFQAMARPDLSVGTFPDLAKVRFYEITWLRVRPGHEQHFEQAAKAYASLTKRGAPNASYRLYEVTAGIPGPTYLVFGSVTAYAEFDRSMAEGMKSMQSATPEELATLQKFSMEGMINMESQRFRVDPTMSYVDQKTKDADPAFWVPKKAPTRTASAQP
jgi:hypothetical protein